MKRLLANIALMLGVLAVCLLIAEIGLRALTPFPIHGKKANKVYDRDFGYRLNLAHETIDRNGFRNPQGKTGVVAAIGDSHTYGSGVRYEEAWPVVFERLAGVPTYNFGVGSYAVYTYYAVGMHALDEGYKQLIIALNIHNDFTPKGTNCAIDYDSSPFWRDAKNRLALSLPTCAAEDTWQTADAPEIIRRYRGKVQSAILSAFDYLVAKPVGAWWHQATFAGKPVAATGHGADTKKEGATQASAAPAQGAERPASWYFSERGTAVLKEDLPWTDLKNPQTLAAVVDFEKMLLDLKRAAAEKGGSVGVLFIPSKVKVVYERVRDRDVFERLNWLDKHARDQIELENRLIAYMDRHGILWKSAEPEIAAEMEKGDKEGFSVYKPSGNHPLTVGFRMYAVAAADLYRKMTGGQ